MHSIRHQIAFTSYAFDNTLFSNTPTEGSKFLQGFVSLFGRCLGGHFVVCVVIVLWTVPHLARSVRRSCGQVVELEAAEDDLDNIQQEIKMLQAFNCPQLTRYHGSFIVGRY